MLQFEKPVPMKCILCGKPIAEDELCYVILTGAVTSKTNFNDKQSLGLACNCLLRAAGAQASKTYEPTMAEREHIARALDESAEQYLKEHAHDKI